MSNNKNPLFLYSVTFKTLVFTGGLFLMLLIIAALLIRFGFTFLHIYWWVLSLFIIFGIFISLFIVFVSNPLLKISSQILLFLSGKPYKIYSPRSSDEIGIIMHFFKKIAHKIPVLEANNKEQNKSFERYFFPKKMSYHLIGIDLIAKSSLSVEVNGDIFDCFEINKEVFIYLGKISGNPSEKNLTMAIIYTSIRSLLKEGFSAKEVLIKTNDFLQKHSSCFASINFLKWDNLSQNLSLFEASNSGVLYYSYLDKTITLIKSNGIALNMVKNLGSVLKETELVFNEKDSFLLYTPGLINSKNNFGEKYGLTRLKKAFLSSATENTEKIFTNITNDFSNFLGETFNQELDISLLVIKNIGPKVKNSQMEFYLSSLEKTHTGLWGWE